MSDTPPPPRSAKQPALGSPLLDMIIRLPKAKGSLREKWLCIRDWKAIKKQAAASPVAKDFPFAKAKPRPDDRFASSGFTGGHYFHQDLLVAQRIFANQPEKHVDIASRIDGFVAHVASFRPIEVFDIRELDEQLPNVTFTQADFMSLDESRINYCDSISCLHCIEHFGLGRYGDPIDIEGHLSGLTNIGRILKPGGTFYFSTPIGPQRIEFNAHRVFSVQYLLGLFDKDYEVRQFSYVDDKGDLHRDAGLAPEWVKNNYGCRYGCGIFELVKR